MYRWKAMKKEVVEYITRCVECKQVKVECRHPTRLLQPISIPEWKWEVISMNFITWLPKTLKQHDTIMVVVDNLRKVADFICVKSTHEAIDIT